MHRGMYLTDEAGLDRVQSNARLQDLVAKVSGVSLRNVLRTMAAMDLIASAAEEDVETLFYGKAKYANTKATEADYACCDAAYASLRATAAEHGLLEWFDEIKAIRVEDRG